MEEETNIEENFDKVSKDLVPFQMVVKDGPKGKSIELEFKENKTQDDNSPERFGEEIATKFIETLKNSKGNEFDIDKFLTRDRQKITLLPKTENDSQSYGVINSSGALAISFPNDEVALRFANIIGQNSAFINDDKIFLKEDRKDVKYERIGEICQKGLHDQRKLVAIAGNDILLAKACLKKLDLKEIDSVYPDIKSKREGRVNPGNNIGGGGCSIS